MLPAPIPDDDAVRLARLRSTGLLDSHTEERFDRVTRLAQQFFKVTVCLISLVDENRQWFKSNQGLEGCSETPRDVSFCGHAIQSDGLLVINDATLDNRFADNPLVAQAPYIRFYAGYPLKSFDGHTLGTLCLIDMTPRELSAEQLTCLADFGKLVEGEITSIHLATIDSLTGLYNRQGFENLTEQVISLSRRSGYKGTLLFIDLDKFKFINDSWGHAAGDEALIAFADCLKQSVRDCDVVARIGGDEFAVYLTHNSGEEVQQRVEQRLNAIIALFNYTSGKPWQLAFSMGGAGMWPESTSTVQELMQRADDAMYEVKQAKGNAR